MATVVGADRRRCWPASSSKPPANAWSARCAAWCARSSRTRSASRACTTWSRQAPAEVAPLLYGLHLTHARLRHTLRQLEQDRAEVEAIFEHMADSVLVLDAHERIVLEQPGRRAHAAQHRRRSAAAWPRSRATPTWSTWRGRCPTRAPDAPDRAVRRPARVHHDPADAIGERRWVQAVATRLPEQRRLLVLQDISELRRAEVARRDFVANVSHELRTPVAALKALVETLEQGAKDDPIEGPRFLYRMHVEVDGLAQLVTELLDLARAEAGRLELRLAPVSRRRAGARGGRAHPAGGEAGRAAAGGGRSPRTTSCGYAPTRGGSARCCPTCWATPTKFTPAAGRIQVGARRRGQGVELWVSDTGVGIEPAHLARVFERFYKTDPSRAAGTGTGLGLAIAKHLVLAHGGQIWAESQGPGRGSTFHVILPTAGPGSED